MLATTASDPLSQKINCHVYR